MVGKFDTHWTIYVSRCRVAESKLNVPSEFSTSRAMQYVLSKNWDWKQSDSERIELETCPLCHKSGYGHFYIITNGTKQDGLWLCHHCGKSSHLNGLKEELGDKPQYSTGNSNAITSYSTGGPEEMPNIQAMHETLLADEDAMDYLVNERGFTIETIKKFRLGTCKRFFRQQGEVKALVYPYLIGDNCIFVHFRSLPPSEKEFSS